MNIASVPSANLQQLVKTSRAIGASSAQDLPQDKFKRSEPIEDQTGTFVHPDSTGKIEHLVLQLDGHAPEPIRGEVLTAWSTVFSKLDPDVKVTITLENERDRQVVKNMLADKKIANAERFNLVVPEENLNITMWARDQMVGLGNHDGGNTLLGQTTMRPHGDDELLPPIIAGSIPGLNFDADKRLQTDGGDEVSNKKETFLGYNSLALTAERLYESSRKNSNANSGYSPFSRHLVMDDAPAQQKSPDFHYEGNLFKSFNSPAEEAHWLQEAKNLFEEKYGTDVTILGADNPDTPEIERPATFHVDMGVTPMEDDRVLVGDPSIAINVLRNLSPEEYAANNRALNEKMGLPADHDSLGKLIRHNTEGVPDLQHQFDDNARIISGKGYDVKRLPYLEGPQGMPWVTYNNCLMENYTREDGSKVQRVFLPTFDIPALDKIAKETYNELGYEVVPLHLAALTSWRGAIRCISNVLDRKTETA